MDIDPEALKIQGKAEPPELAMEGVSAVPMLAPEQTGDAPIGELPVETTPVSADNTDDPSRATTEETPSEPPAILPSGN